MISKTIIDIKSTILPIPDTKNNIPNINMNIMMIAIKNIITNKSTFYISVNNLLYYILNIRFFKEV